MTHVVVTGSSRGIGFGLAQAFVRAGCRVTLSARGPAGLEHALSALRAAHESAAVSGWACDASDAAQVKSFAERAEQLEPIAIWINNAGCSKPAVPLHELDPVALSEVVNTNLLGVMLGTHAALCAMRPRRRGKIYNLEGFGADGVMLRGFAPYGATKAAVRYFSRALAKETKHDGVIVATVDPGVVATDALAALYPSLSRSLQPFVRALAQPVAEVAPRLVRAMLANERPGACLRATGVAQLLARLALSPFRAPAALRDGAARSRRTPG